MFSTHQGFTLIELMVVIALIAMLTGFGLPSYQHYIQRAQISEGFTLAASLQLAVNEFFYETGQVPANLAALGITTPPQGHYIEHATLQNGAIILTYGQQANATLQQKTLRFTPYIHPDQSLIWRCQSALLPSNTHLAPGAQDQTLSSDILPDLLPQTCRP